jgi:holo-[acyl-carrier protein] synthase
MYMNSKIPDQMSVGVDMCEIKRLGRIIDQHGDRFLNKVYTLHEILYCRKMCDPNPSFAVRFAAKEAFLKALGTGLRDGIRWHEIEIINDELGKPAMHITGRAAELLDGRQVALSMSHTRDNAIAFVLLT